MTVIQVAERLQISRQHVNHLCAGTRRPDLELAYNKQILSGLSRLLSNQHVITAGSVLEALAALSAGPDIVLTDFSMPGGTGLELLKEVKRRCPNARRYLMSGATHLVPADAELVAEEIFDKPSDALMELLARIDSGAI